MLVSLRIRNLALIEDLVWEPGPGFNTLTGETGAGKSILIDALNLLLGERADKTLIRTGADACAVEAELGLKDGVRLRKINTLLGEIGAEPCEGCSLLLKRTVSASGANRQFVNGSPVPLQGLKSIGDLLVDVHGPHDHQSLLSTEKQAELLDAYGKLEPLRVACAAAHATLRELEQERTALEMSEAEREQRLSLLQHQTGEINAAKLQPGDDLRAENDYHAASHAQQIVEQAGIIASLLNDSENAVLTQLAQVERALAAWQRMDGSIAEPETLNREAIVRLQELLSAVQARAERVDLNPDQLRQLEERFNLIQSLKRKYGGSIENILAFGEKAAAQLTALESRAEFLATLSQRESAARSALEKACAELSGARAKIAGPLDEKISRELRALGFNQARFQIELTRASRPGPSGNDEIEFIFAPNPGEAPRPLRAIASSGEMARVMLAVKTTLAEVDEIPILIFDEVDANVGGETAGEVGRKLRGLGYAHQVLCVTHLPQVAAQGQSHFAVEKRVRQNRTVTEIARLEGPARQRELARMLGGQTEAALALAKSLLEGK
ncbi:MAG TPA: DNA repair protein RecN [Candidatus Methylacidiphilales bacterium]|nr:DNA repair protein RecN [Candidatus Methylacidiphilales bacterium]